MRRLGLLLLVLSLLLGGVAVWSLRSLGGSKAAAAPVVQAGPRTAIVVAARPLAFGEALEAGALKVQPWPADAVPPGAFRSVAELTNGAPRLALSAIAANEPILPQRVSGPGGRATLSGVIRPGFRAATIRVDDATGVAGFVLPGDFVDVIVTRPERQSAREGEAEAMRADVLLEGVRVLAVDQIASDRKNDPIVAKAATVEVNREQAQKLALAGQVGTLSLALRAAADPLAQAGDGRTIRTADLRVAGAGTMTRAAGPVRRAALRPAAPAGPRLTIYRGSEADSVAVRRE
jgi:pilus assembly protein CpaB